MPRYPNGQIPDSELHIFNRGTTTHRLADGRVIVENWFQGLTPATYRKHLALVALAKRNTGKTLHLASGFSCYRPIYGQQIARTLYGNGAAVVSTSSHGGWWERRETMAMDYANWSAVYGGNRDRFFADCRAVGLSPGLISKARGYPDEPWHVIDLDPWAAVPAGINATPVKEWDEMASPEEIRTLIREELNRSGEVFSLVPVGDGIDVFSLITGTRIRVANTYHLGLLRRARANNGDDLMLAVELDIVKGYLQGIHPPANVTVDVEALASRLSEIDEATDPAVIRQVVDDALKAAFTKIAG
jgi:hypothetical protein